MSELIDNKAHRIQTLKNIIQHLHAGHAPEQVKAQLSEIVKQTDYSEIMAMEQELMAEGMPVEELRSMCDLHSEVTREVLVQLKTPREVVAGHPVDTFKRENDAIRQATAAARNAVTEARALADGQDFNPILLRLRQAFNDLMRGSQQHGYMRHHSP